MVARQISSTYERDRKRRVWETTSSSLKSKRVNADNVSGQPCFDSVSVPNVEGKDDFPYSCIPLGSEETRLTKKSKTVDALVADDESESRGKYFNVILMDIADGPKKDYLTKVCKLLSK